MIVDGDLVLVVSNSGETQEVVRLLEMVRRLGAGIIAMTGATESTLARHADVSLDVGVDREACSLDLVPTASTCAQLAMGDALAVACYEARGFTSDDFARFHPGGRLGHQLRLVESVMQKGDATPSVRESAPMPEVVREISARHLGMACVVDGDGRLLGVITDGDLRRALAENQLPLEASAAQFMTSSAVTIGPDAFAAEALKLMEQRRITALPVVDDQQQLVGVIHLHDLWRTDLF
jgi:arabinose-5-phosphate isomerase